MRRAKRARSGFRGGQGRVPRRPMPREGVVATMRVSGGRGRWGGGMVVGEVGMVWWMGVSMYVWRNVGWRKEGKKVRLGVSINCRRFLASIDIESL